MSFPAEAASGPVTIATTGHVGLNVTDLSRSIRFHRDMFGFEALAESDKPERRYAFLGRDGNLVLTLWQQSAGAFDAVGTRVEVCTAAGLGARPALDHGEPSCGFF